MTEKVGNTFLQTGGKIIKVRGAARTESELVPGMYSFGYDPDEGPYLIHDASPVPHRMPSNVFGDVKGRLVRIIKSWRHRNRNTAVMLYGLRGTGKSLQLKTIIGYALQEGIPVVTLDDVLPCGLSSMLDQLKRQKGKFLFVMDEVEKVLVRKHDQHLLLSFLDGLFDGNMLAVMTANEIRKMDINFFNRPGRILYSYEYGPLHESIVREVIAANLDNQILVDDTADFVLGNIELTTYDILTSLVEEMNIHDEDAASASKHMNLWVDTSFHHRRDAVELSYGDSED